MIDELYDVYGQFIAYGDVYFEIGDVLVHIENSSDYLLQGYNIKTYDLSDEEITDLINKNYGQSHTRRI